MCATRLWLCIWPRRHLRQLPLSRRRTTETAGPWYRLRSSVTRNSISWRHSRTSETCMQSSIDTRNKWTICGKKTTLKNCPTTDTFQSGWINRLTRPKPLSAYDFFHNHYCTRFMWLLVKVVVDKPWTKQMLRYSRSHWKIGSVRHEFSTANGSHPGCNQTQRFQSSVVRVVALSSVKLTGRLTSG